MAAIRILSTGSYVAGVADELPPLKALVREATGASPRRIDRFVQLALVGAGRCVAGRALPPSTATFVTSVRGDLEVTLDVLTEMCAHGRSPTPFAFINTVGNSACFHVAKCFGFHGRSQFVTSRFAPLEAVLRLAALDLSSGGVMTALVGSTEICTLPLSSHRERIGVRADTVVGEGSHWLLLTTDPEPGPELGTLHRVALFPDGDSLRDDLASRRGEHGEAALAFGPHLDRTHADDLRRAAGIELRYDYRRDLPWYDSPTGHAVHRFLAAPPSRRLVHVDGDPSGRRALIVIDAAPRDGSAPTPRPRDRRIA